MIKNRLIGQNLIVNCVKNKSKIVASMCHVVIRYYLMFLCLRGAKPSTYLLRTC